MFLLLARPERKWRSASYCYAKVTWKSGLQGALLRPRKHQSTDLLNEVAFGNTMNDIPMLEMATRLAVAVEPDAELLALAGKRGWTVLDLRPSHYSTDR